MTEFAQFEDAFRAWAESAPLPALARCLDLLSQEITSRGPVARTYMTPAAIKFISNVVPARSERRGGD